MAKWGLEGRYLVVLKVLRVDEGVRVHARVLGVQPLLLLEDQGFETFSNKNIAHHSE